MFFNSAAGGSGLYARGGDTLAPDIELGGANATEDDGRMMSWQGFPGSDMMLQSNDEAWVVLDDNNDEAGNFVVFNGAGFQVFSVNESGDMVAGGTKSALIETDEHGPRLLYAMESPQNWFEDFGSARMQAGQAVVAVEPIYASTVNLSEPYHVFLTPLGDCALYVAEKTPESFTVSAIGGQACDIAFDYRVVALRQGYEALRLEAPEVIED
jgi:hypothetical protein